MLELETVWFIAVALLFTGWVVLDGLDLGVGLVQRVLAQREDERAVAIAAIGPFWNANEVWLIAAGGSLLLAFPHVLGAALSGFYLPVMFIIWALLARGLGIELRGQLTSPLWRSFFDTSFGLGSAVIALLMGVAFGNLLRGVPLDASGSFELPLFTDFTTGGSLGALDWYTLLIGGFAVVSLAAHGASWLAFKTEAPLEARAAKLARRLWAVSAVTWPLATLATWLVEPTLVRLTPLTVPGVVLALVGLVMTRSARPLRGVGGGVAFLSGLMWLGFASLFPHVLHAPHFTRAVALTSPDAGSRSTALWWFLPALALAAGYLWWVLRHSRGKASVSEH